MPIMNGLETTVAIKEIFSEQCYILRPLLFYLTELDAIGMQPFITSEEQSDYLLHKPMKMKDLRSLIKIIKLTRQDEN